MNFNFNFEIFNIYTHIFLKETQCVIYLHDIDTLSVVKRRLHKIKTSELIWPIQYYKNFYIKEFDLVKMEIGLDALKSIITYSIQTCNCMNKLIRVLNFKFIKVPFQFLNY